MNQDKINRMEIEIAGLNKQLEIYHKNNEQIFDFIQSYKKQKSNHSLKNEICSILLVLSEKIENNEKKSSFVNELRAEISTYNNKNNILNENLQNNNMPENSSNKLLMQFQNC